jgi:signal peptidase
MIENNSPKKSIAGKLTTVLLFLAGALCLYVVVQVMSHGYVSIAGYSVFRVVTGSMEPTISPGALLICQQADIAQIQTGDIICFRSLEADMLGKTITHRVIQIFESGAQLCLETKGDANPVADILPVEQSNLIGKVIIYTGEQNVLADIMSFLTSGMGFMICIVLPSLWICGLILRDCVGNIQKELGTVMDELIQTEQEQQPSISKEEYEEMYRRIRQEVLAEKEQLQAQLESPESEKE